ncbi:LysR substrate-binding domain-containing protein [Xanthobacter sp. KR7-225]|uniref:LysR substrate-binding domain-containing protein n=1 Tax=Xanthobacter sp. KR7-225 TaxID=3156613 RepID=UPI0032B573FA
MIETRLLRQFIAVAEELHFHRAAERLNMAQPPLSQAIRKLEKALGVRLFERSNRNVALTPAGASFLDTARDTLLQLEDGAERARRVAAGIAGRLAVTFIDTAHFDLMPRVVRAFRQQFSNVELLLREATTAKQVEAIRTGVADVGFMRWPGIVVPDLAFARVAREAVIVALPEDHPLAKGTRVALADLALDDFVATPRAEGPGLHDQLIGLCRSAGFSPRIVQEARQMQTVVGLVAGGLGVALVPASLARGQRNGVAFRPIAVDAPQEIAVLDLVIGWDASKRSPVRDSFLDAARQVAVRDTL